VSHRVAEAAAGLQHYDTLVPMDVRYDVYHVVSESEIYCKARRGLHIIHRPAAVGLSSAQLLRDSVALAIITVKRHSMIDSIS
jgi:hypothetical protein